jgi:hypothetical protein
MAAASAPLLPPWLPYAAAAAASLALGGVAATWHFHRSALDEKRANNGTAETRAFVMATCGGADFPRSIATPGFVLSSLRALARDVRDTLTGARARVAAEGRAWPDAALAECGDDEGDRGGEGAGGDFAAAAAAAAAAGRLAAVPAPRLLRLHDLAPSVRGRPLVLNFGSWT